MALQVAEQHRWDSVSRRLRAAAPEAFADEGVLLNCAGGVWGQPGNGRPLVSPVDGTPIGRLPMLDLAAARGAVAAGAAEFEAWAKTPLDVRVAKVRKWLAAMKADRELLGLVLSWELGKTAASAFNSVDRCISGVEWYCDQVGPMLDGRTPVGLVSNIASWNYPLSVLVHACAVQALCGNSVIAKTPTDGGSLSITLSVALARREGIPISLISGSGGQLSEALVRGEHVGAFSFVGGKSTGRDIARRLVDKNKPYMLEMEGVNALGVWNFSDWGKLAGQLKKGFEYGKQRCTAYVRFVVQRDLLPKFLETHMGVLKGLRIGNPLVSVDGGKTLRSDLDFGPLINEKKVEELHSHIAEATHGGGLEVYRGELDDSLFVPGQDRSGYLAPSLLVNIPRRAFLYHNEPFGPVDTVIVVDTLDQLLDEMNVSNGNLVGSIATDQPEVASRVAADSRAFKFGTNLMRSRGDREEPFGGKGASWEGCFVGGKYLVQAVTRGPAGERRYGNFEEYSQLPEEVRVK